MKSKSHMQNQKKKLKTKNNSKISIRKAELKDFDQILKLNEDHFIYEEVFTDTYKRKWAFKNQGKEYFATRLVNSNAIALVAEDQKKLVGYLMGFVDTYKTRAINPIAELETLFIVEKYRN